MLPVPPPQPLRAHRTETTVRGRLRRLFDDWLLRVPEATLNGQSAAPARQHFVDCLAPAVRESSSNIEITDELALLLGNHPVVLLGSGLGGSGPEAFDAAWDQLLAHSSEAASVADTLRPTHTFLRISCGANADSTKVLDDVIDLMQAISGHNDLCVSCGQSARLRASIQIVLLCVGHPADISSE